jgi:hypothetical protein
VQRTREKFFGSFFKKNILSPWLARATLMG